MPPAFQGEAGTFILFILKHRSTFTNTDSDPQTQTVKTSADALKCKSFFEIYLKTYYYLKMVFTSQCSAMLTITLGYGLELYRVSAVLSKKQSSTYAALNV